MPGCVPEMKASLMPVAPSSAARSVAGVHRQKHDVAGRHELRRVLGIARLDVGAHELDPDRQRGHAAGLVVADRLALVVAHPDADGDVGIEADEPRVAVVVGRPGLAAERPAQLARRRAGAALHDAAQEVRHHERRVGADGILRLGPALPRAGCRRGRRSSGSGRAACARRRSGTPSRPTSCR